MPIPFDDLMNNLKGSARVATLPGPIMLFEHEGWAIYTEPGDEILGVDGSTRTIFEGDCMTHTGCDCIIPHWSVSRLIWEEYRIDNERCIRCQECKMILPKAAWLTFVKVYNLLNRPL